MHYTVKITKCIKVLTYFLGIFVMFEVQIKRKQTYCTAMCSNARAAKSCFFALSFKSYK
jgi:hypothetical protein